MLILIVAWLYVVILMALTEHSVTAGLMTFLLYGLLPLSITVYLLDTPRRRARKQALLRAEQAAASTSETPCAPTLAPGLAPPEMAPDTPASMTPADGPQEEAEAASAEQRR